MPRDMNGFVAVIRQVAVLQGGVVYYVALAFRHSSRKSMASSRGMISLIRSPVQFKPVVQTFSRSSHLTEYDGVQQERRCGRASRRFVAFGSLAQEVASDLGCSPSKRGMVRLPRTVQILQRAPVTRRAAGIAEDSQEIASGLLIPDASNRLRLALAREPSLSADVSLLPAEQILLPA